jgi:NAD(P)-dependent dehydrogenase (short-subunit alcohol dehydrogenase family)
MHYLGRVHREDPHLAAAADYSNTAAYCQSKLAQVLFAAELQRRTGGAVTAVAVHPGEVLTDVVRSLPPLMQSAYRLALGLVLLTPSQGARSAVHCATSPDLDPPRFQGQSYFDSNCAAIPPSAAAADQELAAWLWGWSAAQVALPQERDLPPVAAAAQ